MGMPVHVVKKSTGRITGKTIKITEDIIELNTGESPAVLEEDIDNVTMSVFEVDDSSDFKVNDVIRINSELMLVKKVEVVDAGEPEEAHFLTVERGFEGSTRSDGHVETDDIFILDNHPCENVLIQNDPDNTVDIFVGWLNAQPIQLVPAQWVSLSVPRIRYVYVRAESGTPDVNWLAEY